MPKIMPQSTTRRVEVWTFEVPRCELCCHKLGPGKPRAPSLWRLLYSFMFPARLNLTHGTDGDWDAGFLIANLKTDARSEILAFIPQSAINNGLTLRHSMVESALCIFISDKWSWYFSCHTLEGISKMQDKAALLLLLSMDKSRRTIYSWKFMVDG